MLVYLPYQFMHSTVHTTIIKTFRFLLPFNLSVTCHKRRYFFLAETHTRSFQINEWDHKSSGLYKKTHKNPKTMQRPSLVSQIILKTAINSAEVISLRLVKTPKLEVEA